MTSSLFLDIVLGLALLGYLIGGFRTGLVRGGFALAGFGLGVVIALWLLPSLLRATGVADAEQPVGALVALFFVLILGALGQLLGSIVGHQLRARIHNRAVARVDSGFGALAHVVVAALVLWFVAASIRPALPPNLSSAISGSRILGVIDRAVPDDANRLFAGAREVLENHGFPPVFTGIGAEPITPVRPPDAAIAATEPIRQASLSVVKVTGFAECDRGQEGSGWVLARDRVVTNAHVVAGVSEPKVQVLGQGPYFAARVVLFDPGRDIAILSVPGLQAPALTQGPAQKSGDPVVVAGFPLNGPYALSPARVRGVLTATGEDIYRSRPVTRAVYSLYAKVEPGNSGGPLLDPQGRVVGVVFARSLDDRATGYALTLKEVSGLLSAGLEASAPVSSGPCTIS